MSKSPAILIMIHCHENTGYAIASLEDIFYKAALSAGFTDEKIFWSFNGLEEKQTPKKIDCNYLTPDREQFSSFLKKNMITTVIAFDLGYPANVIKLLKKAGVKNIISYWGASMSSINTGPKLLLKKIEYTLRKNKPDLFVFESEAMRKTATEGRGVPFRATKVIYLGVDTCRFSPSIEPNFYAHDQFDIPKDRKIIFYSGHMEERKGVRVIIKAAIKLIQNNQLQRIHFVLCGNKGNEAQIYNDMLINSEAKNHVTFAGYRSDINLLMRSSSIGVIASTGWDSFTLSSVEMMASGLPLIVSNLQGLAETTVHEHNGYHITPGSADELAERIVALTTNPDLAKQFSINSRNRALKFFTKEKQIKSISELITFS